MNLSVTENIKTLEKIFLKANRYFYNGQLENVVIQTAREGSKKKYSTLGYITTSKVWKAGGERELYEINLTAEYLSRTIEDVVTTLLHEMAHLYNLMNGIKDVTRGGTYHNKRFKETAEKHGLTIGYDQKIGYSPSELNEYGREFVDSLKIDGFELVAITIPNREKEKKTSSTRIHECPNCGTKARTTKDTKLLCGECTTIEKFIYMVQHF